MGKKKKKHEVEVERFEELVSASKKKTEKALHSFLARSALDGDAEQVAESADLHEAENMPLNESSAIHSIKHAMKDFFSSLTSMIGELKSDIATMQTDINMVKSTMQSEIHAVKEGLQDVTSNISALDVKISKSHPESRIQDWINNLQ